MPKVRLPLVGVHNQRGIDAEAVLTAGQDQRFVNVIFDVVKNAVSGKAVAYLERRPGLKQHSVVLADNICTGLIRSDTVGTVISAFGATQSTIYDSTTAVGQITGVALHFKETTVSTVGCILIRSSDGTGWYYMAGARDQTAYVGDTHTNDVIDGIASTAGMYVGQALSGTGLQAGTRITEITSGVAIKVAPNTTATAAGVALTKTPIAKITDANFVTTGNNISGFEVLDGYAIYASEDGFIYHSDANSVTAWDALCKIAANSAPDLPYALAKQADKIISFGNSSADPFYNAGNPTGSVLSKWNVPQNIGALNQRSIAYLGDDIYYVSSTRQGDLQVRLMRGLQSKAVSTPQVDRILGTANATGSEIYLSAFRLGGYSYLICNVIGAAETSYLLLENDYHLDQESDDEIVLDNTIALDRCLVYNIDLGIWVEWDSDLATFVAGLGEGAVNQIITASRVDTAGKIYVINPAADGELYQDDGTTYSVVIQTSLIDHGTDARKFVPQIDLIADTEEAGTVTLECSDDGYATWTTLGTFDLTQTSKTIHRCGSYVGGRAYRLTHAYNGPLRAAALDITYEATQ